MYFSLHSYPSSRYYFLLLFACLLLSRVARVGLLKQPRLSLTLDSLASTFHVLRQPGLKVPPELKRGYETLIRKVHHTLEGFLSALAVILSGNNKALPIMLASS